MTSRTMSLEGSVVDEDTADTFLHTRKEQVVKGMKVPVSFSKIRKKTQILLSF